MDAKRIRQIINEEMSEKDIKYLIRDELKDYTKKKDFEKLVKKITANVIEDMYRVLYQHSGMWKALGN